MQKDFWLNKWQRNEIGFHRADVHPLLKKHLSALALPAGSHVFVPLCGKSLDLHWLLRQGYRVTGAELSELAVAQLFDECNLTPEMTAADGLKRYSAGPLTVFVGDIFELSPAQLGTVDAGYDRAALIALPADVRQRYSQHLLTLLRGTPQLLITLQYDQTLMQGPPFSVDEAEVSRLYGQQCQIVKLDEVQSDQGLKGKFAVTECVWQLALS